MGHALDPRRDAVLARADELWEQLRERLDACIDVPLVGGDARAWTGKDVYAHLARWQQRSIDDLRVLIDGGRPHHPADDEDALNNRWAQEDRELPAAIARERCLSTRDTLRALAGTLDGAQWQRFGRLFDDITGPHYEHHLRAAGGQEVGR